MCEGSARPAVRDRGEIGLGRPQSVQYGMPRRRPPTVMLTISWTSMMFLGSATASAPIASPNTTRSSGYQSPSEAAVRSGHRGLGCSRGRTVGFRRVGRSSINTPPRQESPVDVSIGIAEERFPAGLDIHEDAGLELPVAWRRREVPGDQEIGHALPRARGETGPSRGSTPGVLRSCRRARPVDGPPA